MAYIIGVPVLALLAILQSSVLSEISLIDGRPDMVLLAVVAWALTGRWREAMVLGLVGGLFLDLLSGLPLGASSITLVVVAFLVSLLEGRFWEAHFLTPFGVVLVASLLYHVAGFVALTVTGFGIDMLTALRNVVLPSTFLNIVLALPASALAEGLRESLFPPEVRI